MERKPKRRWKLGCLAVLLGGVAGCAVWLLPDDDLIPDDDLVPKTYPAIPPERNAYEALGLLANRLGPFDDDTPYALDDPARAAEFAQTTQFREFVSANPKLDKEVESILLNLEFQIPAYEFNSSADRSQPFRTITTGLRIIGENALQSGDIEALARVAWVIADLGTQVSRRADCIVDYIVGGVVTAFGLEFLVRSSVASPLSAIETEQLIEKLEQLRPRNEDLVRVLRGEYGFAREAIRSIPEDSEHAPQGTSSMSLVFKHNRTMNSMGAMFRRWIDQVDLPYPTLAALPKTSESLRPYGPGSFLRGNLVGDGVLGLFVSNDMILKRRFRYDAIVSLTQTALALIAHHHMHGELPERLSELEPQLMDSQQADPYTLEPLRFDRSTGTLYSVGSNQTDDGGGEDLFDRDEPTIRLEF